MDPLDNITPGDRMLICTALGLRCFKVASDGMLADITRATTEAVRKARLAAFGRLLDSLDAEGSMPP